MDKRPLRRLEQDVRNGAQGLKIFKEHGLEIKDSKGRRVPTNDPRFDPIWDKCAELHVPVMIHTGERVVSSLLGEKRIAQSIRMATV